MYRQAIATIHVPDSRGGILKEIIFRQPFHKLGLAMAFNFQKNYYTAFGECTLAIHNPSNEIDDAFWFDIKNYDKRPRVEIRAGYSPVKITSFTEVARLKNALPLIYTGYPYYYYDDKLVNGRVLVANLMDVQTARLTGPLSRTRGETEYFPKGIPVIEVVTKMLRQIGVQYDLAGMAPIANRVVDGTLFFNQRLILADVLPRLGIEYGYTFSLNAGGVYVFKALQQTKKQAGILVNSDTGLIYYPTHVNFTHWMVKTSFARPSIFYPGDWMTVESEHFKRNRISPSGRIQGVVIDAQYDFDDANAMCTYVIAPEGYPYSANPVVVG